MPLPYNTVAVVELFHVSSFTNLGSDFSGIEDLKLSLDLTNIELVYSMFVYIILFLQSLDLKIS